MREREKERDGVPKAERLEQGRGKKFIVSPLGTVRSVWWLRAAFASSFFVFSSSALSSMNPYVNDSFFNPKSHYICELIFLLSFIECMFYLGRF